MSEFKKLFWERNGDVDVQTGRYLRESSGVYLKVPPMLIDVQNKTHEAVFIENESKLPGFVIEMTNEYKRK